MDNTTRILYDATKLLATVVSDMEKNEMVSPMTYLKIKEYFKEDSIPDVMKEKIDVWKADSGIK